MADYKEGAEKQGELLTKNIAPEGAIWLYQGVFGPADR